MYSRYPNYKFSGGVRVPENYSGNAFKPTDQTDSPSDKTTEAPTAAEISDALPEEIRAEEDREEKKETEAFHREKESKIRFPSFKFNLGRMFSGGFGFEELLIIGLILLLSQGDTDDDMILLLALLLFIG